jgi:hypothetical protein
MRVEGEDDDMSEELAGFGDQPWLPLRTRKAMRSEARRELAEAKADEAAREQRAESRRSADLALYAQQAEERGEAVSAHALATGQVAGRTVTAILAMAEAMADIDDRRAAAQERRENGERLNICWEPPRHPGHVPGRTGGR